MDNRRMVIGMFLAMALVLVWLQVGLPYIYKKYGYTNAPPTPNTPATQNSSGNPTTLPSAAQASSPTTGPAISLHAASATPAVGAQLGSTVTKDPTYHLGVTIVPQGAAIDSVVLNEFTKTARGKEPYTFAQPYPNGPDSWRSLATRSITIDGNTVDLSKVDWTLEESSNERASFSVVVAGDSGPVARVRKFFELHPQSDRTLGYELNVTQNIENLTDHPIAVRSDFNGATLPPREQERGYERQVLTGYAVKEYVQVTYEAIESFTKDKPSREFATDKDGNPLGWIGGSSIYFTALIHPVATDGSKGPAKFIEKVTATVLNPDAQQSYDHNIAVSFATTEMKLAPKQSITIPLQTYLGPRQRSVLNSEYYRAFPLGYDQTLVLTSGPCSICTFQWLINFLVMLLRGFHAIIPDWGVSIILLVILIRVILHPVTKRSQISMSKMSKMGPEMERLKKKFGDDKDGLNKAMMDFYKEQGVTPVLGCLPMFLQMPIWIALWQAMGTTFELRHAPFLQFFGVPLTWIHDLSQPDHLFTWPPIPLPFGMSISGLNILPFLLAIVFWLQAKNQPKPAALTPEQEQQQKMMQWMTLLFPVMLYTGPAGSNLYILTSTAIGIVESKIIRKHIKEREEAEKAGRVIVDAGKKFKGGGGGKSGPDSLGLGAKPKKPGGGGIMGWLTSWQDRADAMRREVDKRK